MTPTRCTWSDLPTDQCAHCTGTTTATTWPEQPSAARPRQHAQTALHELARVPALRVVPGQTPDLADLVTELTRTHTQAEPRTQHRPNGETFTGNHHARTPSLVHQLLGAAPSGSKTETGSTTGKSKPAARIEAIDTLMLIDDEASRWLTRLGHDIPPDTFAAGTTQVIPGSGTIATIRRLHGLHASLPTCRRHHGHRTDGTWCCAPHRLEHDVQRWWHQARVISGWDSPAFRPFNTCPICEIRGSLRINLTLRAAICVECRETWTPDTIGLLAEHITAENNPDTDTTTDPEQTSA